MIKITKADKERLERAGLIRYQQISHGVEIDAGNIHITGREHVARDKEYYVVEEPKILAFLGLTNNFTHKKNNSYSRGKKR